jgi:hypothetical protein
MHVLTYTISRSAYAFPAMSSETEPTCMRRKFVTRTADADRSRSSISCQASMRACVYTLASSLKCTYIWICTRIYTRSRAVQWHTYIYMHIYSVDLNSKKYTRSYTLTYKQQRIYKRPNYMAMGRPSKYTRSWPIGLLNFELGHLSIPYKFSFSGI